MSTVVLVRAILATSSATRRMAGLCPKSKRPSSRRSSCARRRWFSRTIELFSRAFSVTATISAGENGFVRKS